MDEIDMIQTSEELDQQSDFEVRNHIDVVHQPAHPMSRVPDSGASSTWNRWSEKGTNLFALR
jgi:hypothetical protein